MSEPDVSYLLLTKMSVFFSTSPTGIYDDWSLDSDVAKKVSN